MEAPVTTRVALLQALRDGPGYGRELIRRVAEASEGLLRLSPARVYAALDALAAEGLLSTRRVSPGGARGARSRTYYELTPQGLSVSTHQRQVLSALVRRRVPSLPDPAERIRMAERLRVANDLSRAARDLERAMAEATIERA